MYKARRLGSIDFVALKMILGAAQASHTRHANTLSKRRQAIALLNNANMVQIL